MHCTQLAELAAIMSQHGPSMIAAHSKIPDSAVTCYWASSRKRFDIWNRSLAAYYETEKSSHVAASNRWWREHRTVIQEIIVSEILTRVIAALTNLIENKTRQDEASPVAHTIHLTHLEISNRVNLLLLKGRGISVADSVKLNRLRKGCERWTDALIGRLSIDNPTELRYAVDRARAQEFASEARAMGTGAARQIGFWITTAAMRDMLKSRTYETTAYQFANQHVADAAMLMFRPEVFDDLGVIAPAWVHRIKIISQLAEQTPPAVAEKRIGISVPDTVSEDIANDMTRWQI